MYERVSVLKILGTLPRYEESHRKYLLKKSRTGKSSEVMTIGVFVSMVPKTEKNIVQT